MLNLNIYALSDCALSTIYPLLVDEEDSPPSPVHYGLEDNE